MNKLLLFAALLSLAFISCKKKGCIDTTAANYSAEAKKDDGSCTYEGDLVIWIPEFTGEAYESEGITSFELFIDNASIGTHPTSSRTDDFPNCGNPLCFNYTYNLGSAKEKSAIPFSYKDNFGVTQGGEAFTLEANECEVLMISF